MTINEILKLKVSQNKMYNIYVSLLTEINKPVVRDNDYIKETKLKEEIKDAILRCNKSTKIDIYNPLQLNIFKQKQNPFQVQIRDLNNEIHYAEISSEYEIRILRDIKNRYPSLYEDLKNNDDVKAFLGKLLITIKEENNPEKINDFVNDYKSEKVDNIRKKFESSSLEYHDVLRSAIKNYYSKETFNMVIDNLRLINDYLNTKSNSVPDLYLKKTVASFLQQAEYIRENNLFDGQKRSHTLEKRKTLEIFDLIKERFNNIQENKIENKNNNTNGLRG